MPNAKPAFTARNVNKGSGILSDFQGVESHDQFGMRALSVGEVYVPSNCHPWVKAFGPLKKMEILPVGIHIQLLVAVDA